MIESESAQFPNSTFKSSPWWLRYIKSYFKKTVAAELSTLTKYVNKVVQVDPLDNDDGVLLELIQCSQKKMENIDSLGSKENSSADSRDHTKAILLNGNLNYHHDIQSVLMKIKESLSRRDRVIAVIYNPLLKWLYVLATALRLRKGAIPSTFLTKLDVENLAKLSGYEVTLIRSAVVLPINFFGVGSTLNKLLLLLPIIRNLSLLSTVVLRPLIPEEKKLSLSILIPARNEKGNIEDAVRRVIGSVQCPFEIIFVEGHSSDGTWEEIQRVAEAYSQQVQIITLKQTGKGKGDAVRCGFQRANCDLLTILDADLTMPPELLSRFYDAYMQGHADMINGSRLVYPMEGDAMRFLNRLGNVFFAKALSYVLGARVGDSLCGTKLFSRADYQRFLKWREDFGDFDPFGDFELIFPSAILGLGIADVPVRYRARVYGSTNISRFRHGFMLLRMTMIGFFKVKLCRS